MDKGKLTTQELSERAEALREDILRMIFEAGSGHPGGSLSCIDMLTVLYCNVMRYRADDPKWDGRDRFVLSKGHVCPALYAILADRGFFEHEKLWTLRKYGSILQGHPYMHKTPGLDVSSGSLGQGLSVAAGMALAAKADRKDIRVYCLMGDGEIDEGQIWEAAMSAGHFALDNLCGILDRNRLQIDGSTESVMGLEPLGDKWRSFGWNVIEIDGHDFDQIQGAFNEAAEISGLPTLILANTVKGKGVSFMENQAGWHGIAPNKQQFEAALEELKKRRVAR